MYYLELGQEGDYDYYCFSFYTYEQTMNFAETIIKSGYSVSIRKEEIF